MILVTTVGAIHELPQKENHLIESKRLKRRPIRLREFDYSRSGAYFVTICTKDRQPLFGEIIEGEMILNDMGKIVEEEMNKTETIRAQITIDKYVIMPNHVHLIFVINDDCRGTAGRADSVGAIHELPLRDRISRRKMILPKIIGRIKMNSSKRINIFRHMLGHPVWQRNYYEHIIRDESELNKIQRYLINNPPKWEYDRENRNGVPIDEKKRFWSKFLNEY